MLMIPGKHKSLIFCYLTQPVAIYPDYQIVSFEDKSLKYVFISKTAILIW